MYVLHGRKIYNVKSIVFYIFFYHSYLFLFFQNVTISVLVLNKNCIGQNLNVIDTKRTDQLQLLSLTSISFKRQVSKLTVVKRDANLNTFFLIVSDFKLPKYALTS